jgi:hypothetical protein
VLDALAKRYPPPAGLFHRMNVGQRGGVRFGVKGMADIVGVVGMLGVSGRAGSSCEMTVRFAPGFVGRFCALECKTAEGRQSADQRAWMASVRECGGFYAVVRSVVEALAAVERCRKGEA